MNINDAKRSKRFEEQRINALKELGISPEEIGRYVKSKEKDLDEGSLFEGLNYHESECQIVASTFFPEMVLSKKDMATIIHYYQEYCLGGNIDNPEVEYPDLLKVAEMIETVKDVMIHSVEIKLEEEEQKIMDKLLLTEIGKRYVYQEMISWCWENISEGIKEDSIRFMQGLIKDKPKGKEYLIGLIIRDFELSDAISNFYFQ
jgi:hypothetical protein